jgi:hypothetical protein
MGHDCLVKAKWAQILIIWVLVAILTVWTLLQSHYDDHLAEATFGAILAGSIATVSLLQLFQNNADGFVRKLVYVGGGSYLILAAATVYLFLKG